MGIYDRLSALGRGAAQSATGGWVDEAYPKILDALPRVDDGTGIPREYAGGSAEAQYKQEYRADDADAAQKYPLNFGAGQILGAAPAAIASGGLGAGGAVGAGAAMGGLQAAGQSMNSGKELAKDAVRGAALGGGLGAAGNLATAAAPAAVQAFNKLRQGPPPGLAPAMATAGAEAAPVARAAKQELSAPQVNLTEGGDRIREAAYKLGGNQTRQRVRFADIQKELPDMPPEQLKKELLNMQNVDQDTVLYRIDDPTDVTQADKDFGMSVAGNPRHIMYLENPPPSARAAAAPPAAPKLDPSRYGNIQDIPMPKPRSANLPPRPTTADLSEVMPESAEQGAVRAIKSADENASEIAPETSLFRKRPVRAENLSELPPARSSQIPKPAKAPKPLTDKEEEELILRENQTADADTARRMARVKDREQPRGESVPAGPRAKRRAAAKPAAEKPAATLQDELGRLEDNFASGKLSKQEFDQLSKAAQQRHAPSSALAKASPAARPMMSADKPLVGPKQLSDDRVLELARANKPANENMPQGAKGLSPEELEKGKNILREQFAKTSSGGNVVSLDDGAMQVANDPFTAGTVREYQQHAKAAEAAGDPEQAAWFRDKIEDLLSGAAE